LWPTHNGQPTIEIAHPWERWTFHYFFSRVKDLQRIAWSLKITDDEQRRVLSRSPPLFVSAGPFPLLIQK
jgi:hypothetical protein